MSRNNVAALRKEVESLKRKLGVAAIVGLLIGGGGVFSILKWVVADRELTSAQTRLTQLEAEVLKHSVLTEILEKNEEELKRDIDAKVVSQPEIRDRRRVINTIKTDIEKSRRFISMKNAARQKVVKIQRTNIKRAFVQNPRYLPSK